MPSAKKSRGLVVTVASFKGGVGKTTTAIHLAALLQQRAPTVLLDGDPNRAALAWNRHGTLPFHVADVTAAAQISRDYTHVVIDTEARPDPEAFAALAKHCDLLVIPTPPSTLDAQALTLTVTALRDMGRGVHYRVLLVKVPTGEPEAAELRAALTAASVPLFDAEIPLLKAFERAAAQGVLVADVKGDARAAKAWAAYEAAGEEIR